MIALTLPVAVENQSDVTMVSDPDIVICKSVFASSSWTQARPSSASSDASRSLCGILLTPCTVLGRHLPLLHASTAASPHPRLPPLHLLLSHRTHRRLPQFATYPSILQSPPLAHRPLPLPRRLHRVQTGRSQSRSKTESSLVSVPGRRGALTNTEQSPLLWILQPPA